MSEKEFEIIDIHAHLGESLSQREGEIGKPIRTTAEELIKSLDKADIDKAIISPIPGYPRPNGIQDTKRQNDLVAKALKEHPDRFPAGLGVVEPMHGEKSFKEIERILDDLELSGLLFHNMFQGMRLDNVLMLKFLEKAEKYDPIIVMHVKEGSLFEDPWRLGRVAEKYPNITLIAGHPALDTQDFAASVYISQKNDNIYLDTCLWHKHLSPFETAIEELGAERILFGSDIPYYRGKSMDLIQIMHAEITDEDREKIFSKNARELFELD